MLLSPERIHQLPYILAALIPALTFHEWGHAFMATKFGDDTPRYAGRLTMNPLAHLDPIGTIVIILTGFIGWAKPVPINSRNFRSSWGELWVAFAGPLMNIILATLAAVLVRLGAPFWFGADNIQIVAGLLQIFIFMNLGLAFFNLIPLGPLDGSHILNRLLPHRAAMNYQDFNFRFGSMVLFGIILLDGLLGVGILMPLLRGAVLFVYSLLVG